MTITMHICRGNFRSTWFSSGGYEPVAKTLFGGCKIDGFFLEYDSDRSGDFKPLRFIKDQKVVLGQDHGLRNRRVYSDHRIHPKMYHQTVNNGIHERRML